MRGRQVLGAVIASIMKIIIAVIVIFFVYHVAVNMYDFGYRIFAEEPVSTEPGETMTVTIINEDNVMEIAEALEGAGLIRDARLFFVQELLSPYKGELKAGAYELSTAMTAEEMMAIMAAQPEEEEE